MERSPWILHHMIQDKKNSRVDRNKATIEDTNEKSTEQHYPSVSQVVDATSTDHIVDHDKSAFQDSQSMKTSNLLDHQKRTVEDDIPMTKSAGISQHGVPNTTQITGSQLVGGCMTQLSNTGNVVDHQRRTVEDDIPSAQVTDVYIISPDVAPFITLIIGGKPGHQMSSSTPSGKAGNVVGRQRKIVEDDIPSAQVTDVYIISPDVPPFVTLITGGQPNHHISSSTPSRKAGNMVDHQKDGANTTQITDIQPNHHVSSNTSEIASNMVDRQRKTVEDDTPSVQVTDVYSHGRANATQMTGSRANHHVSSSTPSGKTGNVVDRQRKTVDGDTPSVQVTGVNSLWNRNKNTTQITGIQPNHHGNSSTSSGKAGNLVDRQRKTVEGDTPVQVTGVNSLWNSHGGANTTQITDMQPNCHVSSSTPSGKAGNVVDRQRKTVEGDTPSPSVQVTETDGIYMVDRRKITVEDIQEELWKIQLHVNITCSKNIIKYLPTSECFEWNKSVIFGRGDVVDIFVNDDQTSRNHVELIGQTLPNGQVLFMTRNISRSKGYNLNGQYITDKNQWMPLNRGDQIKIAGLVCTLDIIPAAAVMGNFVIEFISPLIHHSQVVTIPSPVVTIPSPVMYPAPYLFNGQQSFYYPVRSFRPFANPLGNFVAPQSAHGNYVHPAYLPPNNGMPMQPYWIYGGIQPGQPYLAGDFSNVTGDMLEAWEACGRNWGVS